MNDPTNVQAGEQFFKTLFLEFLDAMSEEWKKPGTSQERFHRAFESAFALTDFKNAKIASEYWAEWAQHVDPDKFDFFWRALIFGNWLAIEKGVGIIQGILKTEQQ